MWKGLYNTIRANFNPTLGVIAEHFNCHTRKQVNDRLLIIKDLCIALRKVEQAQAMEAIDKGLKALQEMNWDSYAKSWILGQQYLLRYLSGNNILKLATDVGRQINLLPNAELLELLAKPMVKLGILLQHSYQLGKKVNIILKTDTNYTTARFFLN